MEVTIALDSENYGVGGHNMKITGEKMIKSSKVGGAQRKRLSDISNLNEQPTLQKRETKQQPSLLMTYEYVDKLQKENMTLMKVLAERNRIIEISGNELEKLRTNFQKLQHQNLQFAQANSQMLAELNSGKERLKTLQHELGCKNGILISRNLDLERKEKSATFQTGEIGAADCNEAEESINANKDNRPFKANRRRQARRESFDPSVLQTEVQKVEVKRPCLRRQSPRFKTEESVAAKDVLEIENSNSTDASQCKEISVFQTEVQKVEAKRPGLRRQSARLKTKEPVAAKDVLEIENSNSIDASQCKETSVLQTEVQKVEAKRPSLRRQSASFKIEEPVAAKVLLEIENSNSTDASQCQETSVLQTEVQKVEAKRPGLRRQSASFKIEEPVAAKVLLEIENSNSTDASQCKETSILQTEVQKVEAKSMPCWRRQSTRSQTGEQVATKDTFEIENSNPNSAFQCKEVVREIVSTAVSSVEREDDGKVTDKSEVQECRRSFVGRPSRRAAEKVQSYKEISLKVKMRRQV